MRILGISLIIMGIIWGCYAFNMNTTVKTEAIVTSFVTIPSKSVHNLDLADRRRNHLIVAGVIVLSGVVLFGFGCLQKKMEKLLNFSEKKSARGDGDIEKETEEYRSSEEIPLYSS